MQWGYQNKIDSQGIFDRLLPIKPDIPDLKDRLLRLCVVKKDQPGSVFDEGFLELTGVY